MTLLLFLLLVSTLVVFCSRVVQVGILDKVEAELGAFKGVMEKSPDFSAYLANPAVTRGEKMTKLDELLPADKISDVTRNLLSTLSANGRLSETGKIVSAFEEILAASKGVVKTEIISAEALDKKSIAAITKAVTGMLPSGQTAQVSARVDPGIVGGLQVMIGDQFMDLSVSSRISAIATELEGADMSG